MGAPDDSLLQAPDGHRVPSSGFHPMRTPSRLMPKYLPPPIGPAQMALALVLVVGLLGAAIAAAMRHPWAVAAAVVGIGVLAHREWRQVQARRRATALSRGEEGICEFARSFDRRAVDTWVIRAVFEELQEELGQPQPFPLRAGDRLVEDLGIDLEELDLMHGPAIASRAGRSLERCPSNPYGGRVRTVADLVHFFNAQPLLTGHPAAAPVASPR